MKLIDKLRHQEKNRIKIDYDYLVKAAPECGKALLVAKLAKRKAVLETVRATVARNACTTIADLLKGKIDFFSKKNGKSLKKNDESRKVFMLVLTMFEEVPGSAAIMDEFTNAEGDGRYPYLSRSFVDKHLADNDIDAWAKSLIRWLENDTVVNSLLEPAQALALNDEILAYNDAGVFKAFMSRIDTKADRYRSRNKRVADLVFRTRRKYKKLNCTQANDFEVETFEDFFYFGVAWPNLIGGVRYVVDHYAPRSTVMLNDEKTLRPGWKELTYDKLNPTGSADVADPMWLAMSQGGEPMRIYIKYGVLI